MGLRLSHSRVTGNALATSPGGTRQGGGLYTSVPFTRIVTTIAGNRPGDVFCASTAPALAAAAAERTGIEPTLD